jgi:hypothetical protein
VDPQLVNFSADLDWLKSQGVDVERFNLSQQPGAFATDDRVKEALEKRGEASLPIIFSGGELVMSGAYPTRDQLAAWTGVKKSSSSQAMNQPIQAEGSCCGPSKAKDTKKESEAPCCEVPKEKSPKGKACC